MADSRASDINGEEDEDEALRLAIALSLGQDPTAPRSSGSGANEIDLTLIDDDGHDHRKTNPTASAVPKRPSVVDPTQTPAPAPAPLYGGLSALGLDRKKMEEERLARLNKRKASSDLGAAEMRPAQRQKASSATAPQPQPARPAPPKPLPQKEEEDDGSETASSREPSVSAPKQPSLPFLKGVVKKTWAAGQPRLGGDDIKIEEVLQRDKLELAVLSSYQWDEEWLLSKIDLPRTKVVLVAFATSEAQKSEMRLNVPRQCAGSLRFCFPPMHGPAGAMHSKLQLLKYDGYLRVVVPTGNLVPYDWGETGVMENMVFVIDLPKKVGQQMGGGGDNQQLTQFGEDLCRFLGAQGLDVNLIGSLRKYDWTETSRYAFVHSIAGSHFLATENGVAAATARTTGYCGLGRAVSALGLGMVGSEEGTIEMDIVCASIGAVNDSLLQALYYACQGDSGMKEYEMRTATGKGKGKGKGKGNSNSASTPAGDNSAAEAVKRHTRVYFPSLETVTQSRGGRNGAGTICLQSKWYEASTFPRAVLRDCKSTRKGLLMHSKVVYVRRQECRQQGEDKAQAHHGFAYVGSANLSESAWGRLVKDRATGTPKVTCRNWECGVVVPAAVVGLSPSSSRDGASVSGGVQKKESDGESWNVFRGRVPVPMELPGAVLSSQGAKKPWFFTEAG
ncbi:tyrosyl-DNA phosphodiesterase-domain-containing protein [Bombardia bombarda]|uniref:Tyrosyl-DNA phosphodiesterase-domain-containing protein n=1 Tax=Bombardia bombarda TaxID=252184 RepID=A0AA39WTF2_9PEZI|nr:tyrosyl-DNA phosphodiesterase-domain-containing protein [Bombardia bombarda]